MPSLKLTGISKSFEQKVVLENIDIDLADGELLVLLGPSGCGKSTLLRLIAGLEELDEGEIYIGERRIDKLQPKDRKVAMVFQNYSLYPHMSVFENLAFPLKVAKENREDIKSKVTATAKMLGLSGELKSRPGQLSGGQRQRVALGRAIIRKPDMFLLDEPLSNLDAELRLRMRREIVGLQKQLNTTMVYVTHDQTEALTMADRLALLHEGKLIQVGTPQELYDNPLYLFVAEFLGQPKINILDYSARSELFKKYSNSPSIESKKMAIRPESVMINNDGVFEGVVQSTEYLGDHLVATLEFDKYKLTVKISEDYPVGCRLRFDINQDQILFFDAETGKRIYLLGSL